MKKLYCIIACILCICTVTAFAAPKPCEVEYESMGAAFVCEKCMPDIGETIESEYVPMENPNESKLIEKALVESGYFNDLIPMDYDLQAELRAACEEFDVPFPLIVAIIDKETNFQNIIGDDGNAEGYMQIWEYWNHDNMEKIGATDLMNPVDNFRTGCYLMRTLLDDYDVYNALSVYNTGSCGYSDYADAVSDLYDYWEAVL